MNDNTADVDRLPRRFLDRANGPLYRQLERILREPINKGEFAIGAELPKEASIAERFGVSLITVRQAMRELEDDGLIKKRSAKPAIVTAHQPAMNLSWSFSNFADIAAFTRDAELQIKSYRKEPADAVGRYFDMGGKKAVYCLRSVLAVGEQKKAQITTYFPPEIGSRLKRTDFDDVLIFRAVQRRLNLRLVVAQVTVRAEIADATLAVDLDIEEGAPILAVEMLYQSDDGRNIELSIARHPADRFSIRYEAPNDLAPNHPK